VCFQPADFTFICPIELRALAELEPELRAARATVVAANTDGYWTHRAWFEMEPGLEAVRYPVIADTSHELSAAYGVLADDGTALRGTFVIDPEGVVPTRASPTVTSAGARRRSCASCTHWRPASSAPWTGSRARRRSASPPDPSRVHGAPAKVFRWRPRSCRGLRL
jgi:peroxiredoxin